MQRSILILSLISTITLTGFCKEEQTIIPDTDLLPGDVPGSSQQTDDPWDFVYEWSFGNDNLLGIAFDGAYLWLSGRGTTQNMMYIYNPYTSQFVDQFPSGATSAWGIRDMCFDGQYICGGWEGGIFCYNITTHAIVDTIPVPTGCPYPRALAYNPVNDHFYCGNFSSQCYEITRSGQIVRQWSPFPLTSVYGMAWDYDNPTGPKLWVLDQLFPIIGINLWEVDPLTMTYTGLNVYITLPGVGQLATGLEYCDNLHPVYTTMLVLGGPYGAACEMYLNEIPPLPAITLTPASLPIVIPANGGSFVFNIALSNGAAVPQTFDVWTKVMLPNGSYYGPIINVQNVTLQAGASVIRTRTQNVPANAPAGNYTYYGYIGDYPNTIWDEDNFPFSKSAAGDGTASIADWFCWGEAFPGEVISEDITGMQFELCGNYPNPFNNTTTISFTLDRDMPVKLTVYNQLGQQAAVLIDDFQSAGVHSAVWNAEGFSSGIYFVQLEGDGMNKISKCLLIK